MVGFVILTELKRTLATCFIRTGCPVASLCCLESIDLGE